MPRRRTAEELALEYLGGKFEKDEHRHIVHKFHAPGSDEETAGREALVWLLKSQLDLSVALRHQIAVAGVKNIWPRNF